MGPQRADDLVVGQRVRHAPLAAELDRFLDEIQAGVVYVNRRAGATTGAWPGNAVLLRLEIERLDRQGRPRPLLPDAVHARAEPDRGRVGGRASG
jgi:hypothetical protein